MAMNRTPLKSIAYHAWLLLLAVLGAYYLYRAIDYRFLHAGRLGPSLFNKQLWYIAHAAFALPVIFGAPLQFVPALRRAKPRLHRFIGKAYVYGASLAAVMAIWLGATIEYEGSRLSLVLTGLLWLGFTLAAWRSAVRKDFAAHRAFMIRSYAMALVLVWLRLMYDFQDSLFFFVTDQDMRDATREWASWVVPLLVVETYLSWLPLARGRSPRP